MAYRTAPTPRAAARNSNSGGSERNCVGTSSTASAVIGIFPWLTRPTSTDEPVPNAAAAVQIRRSSISPGAGSWTKSQTHRSTAIASQTAIAHKNRISHHAGPIHTRPKIKRRKPRGPKAPLGSIFRQTLLLRSSGRARALTVGGTRWLGSFIEYMQAVLPALLRHLDRGDHFSDHLVGCNAVEIGFRFQQQTMPQYSRRDAFDVVR